MAIKKRNFDSPLYIMLWTAFLTILGYSVLGVANYYLQNKAKQDELDAQLILNAFAQPDSSEVIKRLSNFCELEFFSKNRRKTILEKIKNGTIINSNSGLDTIIIGEWHTDPISKASFFIQKLEYTSDSNLNATGIIRRPDYTDTSTQKNFNGVGIPKSWDYDTKGNHFRLVLRPMGKETDKCELFVQKIEY